MSKRIKVEYNLTITESKIKTYIIVKRAGGTHNPFPHLKIQSTMTYRETIFNLLNSFNLLSLTFRHTLPLHEFK